LNKASMPIASAPIFPLFPDTDPNYLRDLTVLRTFPEQLPRAT